MKLEDISEFEKGDIVDVFFERADLLYRRFHKIYFIISVENNISDLGPYIKVCKEMLGNNRYIGAVFLPTNIIHHIEVYNKLL